MLKILLATDGSPSSHHAAEFTAETFKGLVLDITIVHVFAVPTLPPGRPVPTQGNGVDWDAAIFEMEEGARQLLDGTADVLRRKGLDPKTLLLRGHPADEICAEADRERYDLVILASRGESNIKRVLLGSVSDGVVHRCDKPVLVVKQNSA